MQSVPSSQPNRVADCVRLDNLAACVQHAGLDRTECERDAFGVVTQLLSL